MPWLALPYNNIQNIISKFSSYYQGIPHLIFYDLNEKKILYNNGRDIVLNDLYGLSYPYHNRLIKKIKYNLFNYNNYIKLFKFIYNNIINKLTNFISFLFNKLIKK